MLVQIHINSMRACLVTIGNIEFVSYDKKKTIKISNLLNLTLESVFHVLKVFQISSINYSRYIKVAF